MWHNCCAKPDVLLDCCIYVASRIGCNSFEGCGWCYVVDGMAALGAYLLHASRIQCDRGLNGIFPADVVNGLK